MAIKLNYKAQVPQTTDRPNKINESQKQYVELNKPYSRVITVKFHFYDNQK